MTFCSLPLTVIFFFFALFWPHFTHHKGTNDYQHLLLAYRTSWEALKMEKKKKKEREIERDRHS